MSLTPLLDVLVTDPSVAEILAAPTGAGGALEIAVSEGARPPLIGHQGGQHGEQSRRETGIAKGQRGELRLAVLGAPDPFRVIVGVLHRPTDGKVNRRAHADLVAGLDLLGQQVQMAFLDLPVLLPQIKVGSLRGIAIGSPGS